MQVQRLVVEVRWNRARRVRRPRSRIGADLGLEPQKKKIRRILGGDKISLDKISRMGAAALDPISQTSE